MPDSGGPSPMSGSATMTGNHANLRGYAWLMSGQLLSLFGSHVVMFSFAVWVFTLTGSVVEMALLSVCAILPTVLVSPFAGVIADRLPRKPTMIVADSTLAFVSVIVLILSVTDLLQPWHLYISALCGGFAAGMLLEKINATSWIGRTKGKQIFGKTKRCYMFLADELPIELHSTLFVKEDHEPKPVKPNEGMTPQPTQGDIPFDDQF